MARKIQYVSRFLGGRIILANEHLLLCVTCEFCRVRADEQHVSAFGDDFENSTEKKVVEVTAIAVHSTEDRGHIRDSLDVGLWWLVKNGKWITVPRS